MAKRKILLDYTRHGEIVTLRQRAIGEIVRDLSPKWDKFLAANPLMEVEWFNNMVDWLIKHYPEMFILRS